MQCEDTGRDWRYVATSQGKPVTTRVGRGKEQLFPWRFQIEHSPALISGFYVEEYISVVLSHPVCGSSL